jgi:hypothetical protein
MTRPSYGLATWKSFAHPRSVRFNLATSCVVHVPVRAVSAWMVPLSTMRPTLFFDGRGGTPFSIGEPGQQIELVGRRSRQSSGPCSGPGSVALPPASGEPPCAPRNAPAGVTHSWDL